MRGVVEAFELFALSLGRHSQLSNTTNGPLKLLLSPPNLN